MSSALDDAKLKIQSDLDLLKKIEVPDDPAFQEFHAACVNYINCSLAETEGFKQIIDYISKHNPGTDADLVKVDAIYTEFTDKKDTLGKAVMRADGTSLLSGWSEIRAEAFGVGLVKNGVLGRHDRIGLLAGQPLRVSSACRSSRQHRSLVRSS